MKKEKFNAAKLLEETKQMEILKRQQLEQTIQDLREELTKTSGDIATIQNKHQLHCDHLEQAL